MSSGRYTSPHDRALIAFGSDVLAILESNRDWSGNTFQELDDSAQNFGLATTDGEGHFLTIPRARFRERLSL